MHQRDRRLRAAHDSVTRSMPRGAFARLVQRTVTEKTALQGPIEGPAQLQKRVPATSNGMVQSRVRTTGCAATGPLSTAAAMGGSPGGGA